MSPSILYSNKKAFEIYNTPNITNLKANNTNKNFPMNRDKSPINKNEIKKVEQASQSSNKSSSAVKRTLSSFFSTRQKKKKCSPTKPSRNLRL